jgi:hypothetical protein
MAVVLRRAAVIVLVSFAVFPSSARASDADPCPSGRVPLTSATAPPWPSARSTGRTSDAASPKTLTFNLPDAMYGGPCYLTVNLDFTVHRVGGDQSDNDSLEVGINGFAVLKAFLTPSPTGLSVMSGTLIDGSGTRDYTGSDFNLHFANYAQPRAAQVGPNLMTLNIDQQGPHPVADVEMLETSFAEVTSRDSEELSLASSQISAAPDSDVQVPFRLLRRGARPDGPTSVKIMPLRSDQARIVGPDVVAFESVDRERVGHFTVHTGPTGDLNATLAVIDRYNSPVVIAPIRVSRSQTDLRFTVAAVGLATFLVVGLAPLRFARRTARRLRRNVES